MGIKISRNLKTPETPATGFDISGVEGKEYNLEQIEQDKSRTASQSPLAVHVNNDKKGRREGGLTIGGESEKLNIGNLEYKKYLLSDTETASNTISASPTLSLKRPVLVWEDATLDTNQTKQWKTLVDEIAELKQIVIAQAAEIQALKSRIVDSFDITTDRECLVTDKNSIPTAGAIFDYIQGVYDEEHRHDYVNEEVFGLQNGTLEGSETNYGAVLEDDQYRMTETDINEFGLGLRG